MMQASSTAKMGLLAQQVRMDTIANNLANVNTSGFKVRRVEFKDMLYNKIKKPEGDQEVNLQKGTGVFVASTDLKMDPGIPEMTGMPLDFFIDGDGMFSVTDGAGETVYTRNGAFSISVEEDGRYLVTGNGYYVLDQEGERITLPNGATMDQVEVNLDGTLGIKGSGEESFAKLGIFWFNNAVGLDSMGNSSFVPNEASGEAVEIEPGRYSIRQGYLEAANVDVGTEMVNMIKTQRAFSFASKAITTADEMDALANNMRN